MRRFSLQAAIAATSVGVFTAGALAGTVPSITFYDGKPLYVQSVVGNGPDIAYAVIDLQSGPGVAWQYNFNHSSGPVTAWQMLNDIQAADPNLFITATFYASFGNEWYINNLQYGNAFGAKNQWDFYTSTYSSADVSASDPQGTTGWAGISAINTTDLSNGEIVGGVDLYPNPNQLRPVLPETAAPVPEPAVMPLATLGSAVLMRRRNRRKVA